MNTINSYNNNIQFKGLFSSQKLSHARKAAAAISASKLTVPESDVLTIARKSTSKQWSLFNLLADKFNSTNFYRANSEKENPDIVKEIFETVKKVREEHLKFLYSYENTLNNVKRVFTAAKDNKTRLRFALKINNDIQTGNPKTYQDIIPELLESPNSKEYIKHYDKYKLYLQLHAEDKDVVKNLDKLIETGTFSNEKSTLVADLHKKNYNLADTETFNSTIFANAYTPARGKIFTALQEIGLLSDDIFKNGGDNLFKNIFLSSNNKNIENRANIIWHFNNPTLKSTEDKVEHLKNLDSLFTRIDEDKHANSFVKYFINSGQVLNLSLNELLHVLNNMSNLKLNIFRKNALQIIRNTNNGERLAVLQNEIENPFYESYSARINRRTSEKYGFKKKASFWHKTISRLKNQLNILEYKIRTMNSNTSTFTQEVKPTIETSNITNEQIKTTPVNVVSQEIHSETSSSKAVSNTIDTGISNNAEIVKNENITDTKNDAKSRRAMAKTQTKQNIFNIISSKLGLKTLEKQRDLFGANATKIRLSLLPEIFASIADTRKIDRAIGKHKINSSNKDALELYLLINGSNKKYINYLLKKRNTDNTRMFEVKDIIANIKKAEAKIAAEKKSNPNYRANDARKYYNHLYEAKIEQYGKIKRQGHNINKKA